MILFLGVVLISIYLRHKLLELSLDRVFDGLLSSMDFLPVRLIFRRSVGDLYWCFYVGRIDVTAMLPLSDGEIDGGMFRVYGRMLVGRYWFRGEDRLEYVDDSLSYRSIPLFRSNYYFDVEISL